jgi:hypothetical protein
MRERTVRVTVRSLALLTAIGVAVFGVVGCGAGGSSSTDGGTSIGTKTEAGKSTPKGKEAESPASLASEGAPEERNINRAAYIARANAICDRTDRRQAARYKVYKAEHGEAKSTEAEEEVVTQVGLPMIKVELVELRTLGAPKGEAKKVGAVLVIAERALASAETDPSLVLDPQKNPFELAESLAAGYGYKSCGLQ